MTDRNPGISSATARIPRGFRGGTSGGSGSKPVVSMLGNSDTLEPALILTFERFVAEVDLLVKSEATVRVVARLGQVLAELGLLVLEYRRKRVLAYFKGQLPSDVYIGSLVEITGRVYTVSRRRPGAEHQPNDPTFRGARVPVWVFDERFVGLGAGPTGTWLSDGDATDRKGDAPTSKVIVDVLTLRTMAEGFDIMAWEEVLREREFYLREYFACLAAAETLTDQTGKAPPVQQLYEGAVAVEAALRTGPAKAADGTEEVACKSLSPTAKN